MMQYAADDLSYNVGYLNFGSSGFTAEVAPFVDDFVGSVIDLAFIGLAIAALAFMGYKYYRDPDRYGKEFKALFKAGGFSKSKMFNHERDDLGAMSETPIISETKFVVHVFDFTTKLQVALKKIRRDLPKIQMTQITSPQSFDTPVDILDAIACLEDIAMEIEPAPTVSIFDMPNK
eukprot:TRINITY_DN8660_c0_g1_i1.p1 TRINITY_DN8660_c0_g1~~TRINITY_DN8660_c0_g1_i1.p1  ORF type:complete len:176 (-),score=56.90 TRINITY_DN8660_c0_g1_i1:2-529(-)